MFLLALMAAAQVAPPAPTAWHFSYDDAYRRGSQERKPVLVLFTNRATRPDQLAELANLPGLDRFVPVFASRHNEIGRKLYGTFALVGDEAFVILDRTLRWQFLRYERRLDRNELQTVLSAALQNADQRSIQDPLRNVSAYVSPETQPTTDGATTMPYQFPRSNYMPAQPNYMPMQSFGGYSSGFGGGYSMGFGGASGACFG